MAIEPGSIETGIPRALIGSVGVLLLVLFILGAIPSLALGLGGIENHNGFALAFSLGFLLSGLGLFGGWWRVSRSYLTLSSKHLKRIRVLVSCGVLSCVLMSVGTLGIFGVVGIYGVLLFFLVAVMGGVVIHATPKAN